jgi:hypothetical protein
MGNKKSVLYESCWTRQHLPNYDPPKDVSYSQYTGIKPRVFNNIRYVYKRDDGTVITKWTNDPIEVDNEDHSKRQNILLKECADVKNKIWKQDRGYNKDEHSYTIEQDLTNGGQQAPLPNNGNGGQQAPFPNNGNVSKFSHYFYKIDSNWRDRNNRKFIGRCHGRRETHPLSNGEFVPPFEVNKKYMNKKLGFDDMVYKMHLAEKKCYCKYNKMKSICKK